MSWDNFDDDFLEFAKFNDAKKSEHMFDSDQDVKILYIHVVSTKLVEFINRWGKTQYKIKIKTWDTMFETGTSRTEYWLAGGKRMFGRLKPFIQAGIGNLKILRVGKGFDTEYIISEFSNTAQQILDT